MLGLVLIFVSGSAATSPTVDMTWIAQGGGLLKKGVHPAGQEVQRRARR
jgi:hypothetical protein